ncbi:MAG: hypothetical protein F6K19_21115 [Cyanothece sp. SIO1E1]|nr:hypothetical protein [Cyanothece sp. SIO1E1]
MYILAFEQARVSLPSGALWVGDCKMGALATRAHIHHHQHYYLMPLARTGQVSELLAQWLVQLPQQESRLEQVRLLKADGSISRQLEGYVTSRGVEGETPEGYPVCWREQVFLVHSANHHQQQQRGLEQRLQTAMAKLLGLTPPVGRGRKQIKTETQLVQQAQSILKSQGEDYPTIRILSSNLYGLTRKVWVVKIKDRYFLLSLITRIRSDKLSG